MAMKKGYYHVKYIYYPAWRAFWDAHRLPIEYNEYGMFINVPAPGKVTIRYNFRYCWEWKYRTQFVDYGRIQAS